MIFKCHLLPSSNQALGFGRAQLSRNRTQLEVTLFVVLVLFLFRAVDARLCAFFTDLKLVLLMPKPTRRTPGQLTRIKQNMARHMTMTPPIPPTTPPTILAHVSSHMIFFLFLFKKKVNNETKNGSGNYDSHGLLLLCYDLTLLSRRFFFSLSLLKIHSNMVMTRP